MPKIITAPERAARRKQPLRGLGDVIAAVTKAVGLPVCGGCRERQKSLNRLVPFGKDVDRNKTQH